MIEVDGVTVRTGDLTLLPAVTVSAQRGSALVIRGANGSGKSTLLRVLAGTRMPSHGRVRIDGEPVAPRDPGFRRRVAAMIGPPPTAPDLTVFEHALLVATTWTDDAAGAAEQARRVLAELGLTPLEQRFPHELSSGQTQLFGIALVLARPFEVLILDEPEQRLDPEHLETMIGVLRARRADGAAVVVSTHSPTLAEAIADQTLWLDAAA